MISNNEKREQIVKLFNEEKRTPKSLSEEFGVPISTIYVWVRNTRNKKEKDEIIKKVVSIYKDENKSPETISKELGIPTSIIITWLSREGVELKDDDLERYRNNKNDRIDNDVELTRLKKEVEELKEQNKVLQDSLKYLTELLNIKNGENKPQ